MSEQVPIMVRLNKNLLIRIDQKILREKADKAGYSGNRSKFITEACEYFLTIRDGIPNILKRRMIQSELDKPH